MRWPRRKLVRRPLRRRPRRRQPRRPRRLGRRRSRPSRALAPERAASASHLAARYDEKGAPGTADQAPLLCFLGPSSAPRANAPGPQTLAQLQAPGHIAALLAAEGLPEPRPQSLVPAQRGCAAPAEKGPGAASGETAFPPGKQAFSGPRPGAFSPHRQAGVHASARS